MGRFYNIEIFIGTPDQYFNVTMCPISDIYRITRNPKSRNQNLVSLS